MRCLRLLALSAFVFSTLSAAAMATVQTPVPIPTDAIPGTYVDLFDDGVVGPEFSPIGDATLVEQGGQLHVYQGSAGGGVLVKYPNRVAGQSLFVFCARVGFPIDQLGPDDWVSFEAVDVASGGLVSRRSQGKATWTITKDPDNPNKYTYKVYKDGNLTTEGEATIPEGATGFRIDKVPGTNMVIGEVLFPDNKWEKLWEHDPPEIPFGTFSVTSNLEEFALDEVMGGLHTDDGSSEGATGDLVPVVVEDGGFSFTPLGGNLYDVEVVVEDWVTFAQEGEAVLPFALEVGGEQAVAFEVKCRGGTGGTCSGQSSCSTKTCPDIEYDIGDGNGYRTYSGTCKKAQIGLPLCSCSYSLKKTLRAVEILPNELVTLVVDPKNEIPEIIEGNNRTSTRPSVEPFGMVMAHSCRDADADRKGKTDDRAAKEFQTTIKLSSGYFDASRIAPETIQMVPVTRDGMSSRSVPLSTYRTDGRTVELDFADDGSLDMPDCPTEMVVLGAAGSPLQFWSVSVPAVVFGPAYPASVVRSLIGQLEALTPTDAEVGTPQVQPNSVTDQLVAIGDLALPELVATLSTGSPGQKAFAAFVLGEIGNPSVIPDLEALRDALENQSLPLQELDYMQLAEAREAITALGGAPLTTGPGDTGDPSDPDIEVCADGVCKPVEKRCCVSAVDAVTSGPFQGGKRAGDYYPERANDDGTSDRWSGDGSTAGPHNIGSPPAQRTGALVQIVGTMDGDRSCCTISQHFTIEKSNYDQDSAPVGENIDDLGRSGRDVQNAPFRQQHGANGDSFCDYPARQYNAPPGRLNYCRKQRFTSCYHSYPDSVPPCQWEKCCVTWVLEQNANGNNATTTVTKIGSFCSNG
ncbi:MAG: hypothetical protein AAF481_17205 [Acidobacteriota bacterium]